MPGPLRTVLVAIAMLFLPYFPDAAELPLAGHSEVIGNLPRLAHKSGYIFSGTVKSVARISPTATDSVGVVRITFHVEKGYLGVGTGEYLVISEYAGLWQSGETYRPGEKVLLFLYPPSKLGLTSPVGGMSGRFAVDPGGHIIVGSGRAPLMPVRNPGPIRHGPERIQLTPEEFSHALHSALENRP
ncbi:MAG: hypothetical protein JOZ80_00025 [Acidobacteriaceae bacterium]|nr:hypothetical protein [Acidobacteriaceae bacterium]